MSKAYKVFLLNSSIDLFKFPNWAKELIILIVHHDEATVPSEVGKSGYKSEMEVTLMLTHKVLQLKRRSLTKTDISL